jgi:hypothetical protein
MPFKDVEKKRAYQRDYKRRQREWRAAQAQRVTKAYLCTRHPHLQIAGVVQFQDGFYVTGCLEKQRIIEEYEGFGSFIVGWPVEPDLGPGPGGEFIL